MIKMEDLDSGVSLALKCWACDTKLMPGNHTPCCSSHGRDLCCKCYQRLHFVETGCCP